MASAELGHHFLPGQKMFSDHAGHTVGVAEAKNIISLSTFSAQKGVKSAPKIEEFREFGRTSRFAASAGWLETPGDVSETPRRRSGARPRRWPVGDPVFCASGLQLDRFPFSQLSAKDACSGTEVEKFFNLWQARNSGIIFCRGKKCFPTTRDTPLASPRQKIS